jgi:hypothetical protein
MLKNRLETIDLQLNLSFQTSPIFTPNKAKEAILLNGENNA